MSSSHSNTNMLYAPVVSMYFRYSLPWTFSFLLLSSAGMIDAFFVGQYVGPMALASLNIVWPIFSLITGIGIALVAGGSVRCASYIGTNNVDKACAVYTKIMVASFVSSLIISIVSFVYSKEIVTLLGADQSLIENSSTYLQTVSCFFTPFLIGLTWPYFLRVDERPALASMGLVLTAAVNIVLDYIFIAHLSMGIQGAALATGISYVSIIIFIAIGYLANKKPRKLFFTSKVGSWLEVLQSVWNGISEMINEMSTGIVLIVMNITMMNLVGPYGVAAFTVINIITWFCLMLCYGFSDSLSPLVSANNACKLNRRVKSLFMAGAAAASSIGLLCFLAMTFYPYELVSLFIEERGKTADFAVNFMYYSRFIFLFCGFNIIVTAYFTGLLEAGASAIVAILRTLILPIAFISILPNFFQTTGVAIALPLGEFVTLLVGLYLMKKIHIKKNI